MDDDRPPLELLERRLTPHDIQAEEAVLGAVMISGALIAELLDVGLQPADFYRDSHAAVFEAMVTLHQRGDGVDHLTIEDELRRSGRLEEIGGPAAVHILAGAVPVLANALDYARVVRRLANTRRRMRAAMMVVEDPDAQERWAEFVQLAESPTELDHDRRELDLHELLRLAETEPPWRCGELAADGHLTLLVGRGGEGKSLFTLALAGAVQLGTKLAGIECKRGSVVIFDAENGPWVMGSRLKQAETPIDNLRVFDAEGLDLRRNRAWFTSRAEGADLVIFDSVRTLAPGAKENDSDDMAPVMGAIRHVARTTGAAVIAIHHRGKGEGDFRGSSAMRDQCDLMFVLERDDKDPDRRWRRGLRCVKARIGAEPETRWIGIRHAKGELYLTEAAPFEPEVAARPVRDELEDTIAQVVAANGPITRKQIAREIGRTENDGSVRRALKELEEDELIVKISGHRYITAPVNGVDRGATLPLAPVGTPGTPGRAHASAHVRGVAPLAPPPANGSTEPKTGGANGPDDAGTLAPPAVEG